MSQLLTVNEAAKRLGIGRSFLYELIKERQISFINVGGRNGGLRSPFRAEGHA